MTNRILLQGLKKRVENARGLWAEELPSLLWAYRTTRRTATGESPFSLAFGVDAVIPVEIGAPSPRREAYNERANTKHLRSSLDLIEETREKARVRIAAYQQRVARYYDSKMKERAIRTGDLFLRRAEVSDPPSSEKLAPTWEDVTKLLKSKRCLSIIWWWCSSMIRQMIVCNIGPLLEDKALAVKQLLDSEL
ncbi:uncharacterized protein LOC143881986 [Tasmannia lanceolata]|uniref:uncharacterized protein LOC143881986 n=1 Tax=Tasmannia lanceolata TaxID=3420 RepID=UPI0040642709